MDLLKVFKKSLYSDNRIILLVIDVKIIENFYKLIKMLLEKIKLLE